MKKIFNLNASLGSVKLLTMLLIGSLIISSCKKDMPATDETTDVAVDSSAMAPETETDSAAMPMDSTTMSGEAAASDKDAMGDDTMSIQKALRTIKEAKMKSTDASDEIVLGTTEKSKRKCAMVTFKNGASGRVCASKDAIERMKTECGNTKDCEVKDAQ